MLAEAPYIVQEDKPISSKDTTQSNESNSSPFIVPPFTPPQPTSVTYTWWCWHPNYPFWSKSCWNSYTIEDAQHFLTDQGTGLRIYHNKLIRHDGIGYTEVQDEPCREMDVWWNIKRHREKEDMKK